jgi:hypothetical protein
LVQNNTEEYTILQTLSIAHLPNLKHYAPLAGQPEHDPGTLLFAKENPSEDTATF